MRQRVHNTEMTQYESSYNQNIPLLRENISLNLSREFLFNDTSKNDCFSKILEVPQIAALQSTF